MFNISDDRIFLIENGQNVTWGNFCERIKSQVNILKTQSNRYLIVNENKFLEDFFAGIFAGKELILNSSGLKNLAKFSENNDYIPPNEFNPDKIFINFSTSGSSGNAKFVKKSLQNLIIEANDARKIFTIPTDYLFATTTKMQHLFGITFALMFPLLNGNPIKKEQVQFLEQIKSENFVLVSTPSFLDKIVKYNDFLITPKYVFTAGAKLSESTFEKLEKDSKIIEIYGSTESGIIAHKTKSNTNLKLFDNVEISQITDKSFVIKSEYFFEPTIEMNDRIKLINNREIILFSRSDRVLKIQEKRIDTEALEKHLKENPIIEDCYCLKKGDKLAAMIVLSPNVEDFETLIYELKKYVLSFSEIIPQKWRFVPEIPRNCMGKIDHETIDKFFSMKLSNPIVYNLCRKKSCVKIDLLFPKSCNFFMGHFKNQPILPGVVQLYFAKFFADILLNVNLSCKQVKKIKFSKLILPYEKITLEITNEEKIVNFNYSNKNGILSQGSFVK